MLGGVALMVNNHMIVAVSPRGLLVRIGQDAYESALTRPDTRAMVMKGRAMPGYVFVDPCPTDRRALRGWVRSALQHNRNLPPKNAAGACTGTVSLRAADERKSRDD